MVIGGTFMCDAIIAILDEENQAAMESLRQSQQRRLQQQQQQQRQDGQQPNSIQQELAEAANRRRADYLAGRFRVAQTGNNAYDSLTPTMEDLSDDEAENPDGPGARSAHTPHTSNRSTDQRGGDSRSGDHQWEDFPMTPDGEAEAKEADEPDSGATGGNDDVLFLRSSSPTPWKAPDLPESDLDEVIGNETDASDASTISTLSSQEFQDTMDRLTEKRQFAVDFALSARGYIVQWASDHPSTAGDTIFCPTLPRAAAIPFLINSCQGSMKFLGDESTASGCIPIAMLITWTYTRPYLWVQEHRKSTPSWIRSQSGGCGRPTGTSPVHLGTGLQKEET